MYYLLIECIEREIYVTPCGFNEEYALKKFRENFIEANEPYLEKEEIEQLQHGIYPEFREDVAYIADGVSWSNMNSSSNYDSVIHKCDEFAPIITYEDAKEVLQASPLFRKSEEFIKTPEISASVKKIIPGLCEMRDGIEKVLRLIDAGEEIPLEDIHFIQSGFMDFNSAL